MFLFESYSARNSLFNGNYIASDSNNVFYENDDLLIKMMHESFSGLYHGLCCNSTEILTESLTDYLKSAYEFFKKIIKSIVEFVNRIFGYLASFFGDFEKDIDKWKDRKDKFKPFQIQCYTYTITKDPINDSGIKKILNGYNSMVDKIGEKEISEINTMIRTDLGNQELDKIRGAILGKSDVVASTKFESALQKMFRDGKSSTHSVEVNSSTIDEFITKFKEMKEIIDNIRNESVDVKSLLDEMADFFHQNPNYQYKDTDTKTMKTYKISADNNEFKSDEKETVTHTADKFKKYTMFYNYCFRMCKEMSNIYTKAYTVKVNIIKEAVDFYRGVIRKALISPFTSDKSATESTSYITEVNEEIHSVNMEEWEDYFYQYIHEVNVMVESYRRGYVLMEDVEANATGAKKGFFTALIDTITSIINKFINTAKRLFQSREEWFSLYANKILEIPDANFNKITITLKDYDKFSDYQIPSASSENADDPKYLDEKIKTEEAMAKVMYPSITGLTKTGSIIDGAKIYFRGGTDNVKSYTGGAAKTKTKMMVDFCNKYVEHCNNVQTKVNQLTEEMEKRNNEYEASKESMTSYVLVENELLENTVFAWLPFIDTSGNKKFLVKEAEEAKQGAEVKQDGTKAAEPKANKEESKQGATNKEENKQGAEVKQDGTKAAEPNKDDAAKKENTRKLLNMKMFYSVKVKVATTMLSIVEERFINYIETLQDIVKIAGLKEEKK